MTLERHAMADENRFTVAGEWLLRLQAEDISAEEFSEWMLWYEANPLNRAAFDEAQAMFEAARGLSAEERDRGTRILKSPGITAANEEKSHGAGMQRGSRASTWTRALRAQSRRVISVAAAAVIVLAIGAVAWLANEWAPQPAPLTATFQTPLATHRTESLPDGSVVRLGARSSISLHYSSDARYVVLETGEALFTVAKDSSRPFVVQAGQVSVRAVGTEFNVRRAAESTTVAVSEGIVEVVHEKPNSRSVISISSDPPSVNGMRLTAGDQVTIEAATETPAVKPIHLAAVSSWQRGRLEFANEPLRLVVATVNRYSLREIVVTDPSLNDLPITGTVNSQHADEWLRALPEIIPVQVTEISKGTVLISPTGGK